MLSSKSFEIALKLVALWPLSSTTPKLQKRLRRFVWWFNVANFVCVLVPIALALVKSIDDVYKFSICWSEMNIFVEMIVTYVMMRQQGKQFLELFEKHHRAKLKSRTARRSKDMLRLQYLNITVNITIISFYMLGVFSSSFERLPLSAWYPFSTTTLHYALISHQIYVILNCFGPALIDAAAIEILGEATVALDALKARYESAVSSEQLIECVREHQRAIRFVERCCSTFRVIIIKTMFGYIGYFIATGFCLLNSQHSSDLFKKYLLILVFITVRVYVYAESADRISLKHSEIKFAIYNATWLNYTKEMTRTLIIVMQNCQKPITISYMSIMPNLDIKFLSGYFYLAFTYFMALRTVHNKIN